MLGCFCFVPLFLPNRANIRDIAKRFMIPYHSNKGQPPVRVAFFHIISVARTSHPELAVVKRIHSSPIGLIAASKDLRADLMTHYDLWSSGIRVDS
jgi:hypothetical protein